MEGTVLSQRGPFVPVARGQQEFCQLPACSPGSFPGSAGEHLDDADEAYEAGKWCVTDACRRLASHVRTAESAGYKARRNRRTGKSHRALQRILALPTSQAHPEEIYCSSGCGQAKGTNQEANPTPTSSPSLVAALLSPKDTLASRIAIILPREVG